MPRYVAFLRGVSPQNLGMADLKRCADLAGFGDPVTVLSSGNVVFDARSASLATLEQKLDAVLLKKVGRSFFPIVRSTAALQEMLATDPYAQFAVPKQAKRIVSFLRKAVTSKVPLPIQRDGAQLLEVRGTEVFTAYVPNAKGPVFMVLIEKAFGTAVTTRTWETVKKCAAK